jgi:hypothetical protein
MRTEQLPDGSIIGKPIESGSIKKYIKENSWLDWIPDVGAVTIGLRNISDVNPVHLFYQPVCLTATAYVITRLSYPDAVRLFGII